MTDFLNRNMPRTDVEIHGDYDARFEPVVHVLRKQIARYGEIGRAHV